MPSTLMETASGKMVDVMTLRKEDVDLNDIFTHLSRMCRFNGAFPVTVAQHSLGVAEILRGTMEDTITQLRGLAHDFAEAYLPDMISPHKVRDEIRPFLTLEWIVLEAVWRLLEIGDLRDDFVPSIVRADRDMLILEASRYSKSSGRDWDMYDKKLWENAQDNYALSCSQYLEERHPTYWRGMLRNKYMELWSKVLEERKVT